MSADTTTMPSLRIDPARAATLLSNITQVNKRISQTCTTQSRPPPRLVAVSKLKPASDILALHQPPAGSSVRPQLHFGENYVQELRHKAELLPKTIRWHFIGGLQSNKAQSLARDVPNLWAVESVDSEKKARLLNKGRGMRTKGNDDVTAEDDESGAGALAEDANLRVFVQVNTSGEASKSGVDPKSTELRDLCRLIRDECAYLKLQGLMTIGAIARSQSTTAETENEDFVVLRESRDWVVEQLGLVGDEADRLELSMGMSEDFESAIVMGSAEVRVGSTIFGERPPKSEAKVLEEVEDEKS